MICPRCERVLDARASACLGCGLMGPANYLKPGTRLQQRYTVTQVHKLGGMGTIYAGSDSRLGRRVVIKQLREFREEPEKRRKLLAWFRREATLMAGLDHPQIPHLKDYFEEAERFYIIMDFVEGMNLEEVLQGKGGEGLPESLVLEWGIQVCDILAYLHRLAPPIIHRDIKPQNFICRDDGIVVMIDFGIARSLAETTTGVTTIGTNGYAPMEQYQGEISPRSDIYALGATMHHLLTGKAPVPFRFEEIRAHNPQCTPALEEIVRKTLAKEPGERYGSALELKMALLGLKMAQRSEAERILTSPPAPQAAPSGLLDDQPCVGTFISQGEDRAFDEALKRYIANPRDALACGAVGALCFRKGDWARAAEFLEKAAQLEDNHVISSLLGSAYIRLGDLRKARAFLDRAMLASDREPATHLALAELHEKSGEPGEARAVLRKAINMNLRDPRLHLECGRLFENEGKYAEAVRHYQEAGKLDSRIASRVMLLTAQIYGKLDLLDEALEEYGNYLRCNRNDPEVMYRRAEIYRQKGENEKAFYELDGLLKIDPGYTPAYALMKSLCDGEGPVSAPAPPREA